MLVKLTGKPADTAMTLDASYEDSAGTSHTLSQTVNFPKGPGEFCDNPSVRKAVLLSRYVTLMRQWAKGRQAVVLEGNDAPARDTPEQASLGRWERPSQAMRLDPETKKAVEVLIEAFTGQMALCQDPTLAKELEVLKKIQALAP